MTTLRLTIPASLASIITSLPRCHQTITFTLLLAFSYSLTSCAATDEAVHRGHIRTGATVAGAGAGALLLKNNRIAGGILGAQGGNLLGGLFEQQYKNNKQNNENAVLHGREQRLRSQQQGSGSKH